MKHCENAKEQMRIIRLQLQSFEYSARKEIHYNNMHHL